MDKVIGFIHGIVHNDPISCGPLLFITAFYIIPRFRRKGKGTLMLDLIIKEASSENRIQGVEISTSHRRALRLYRRLGFRQFRADFGEIFLNLDLEKRKGSQRDGPKA